MAAIPSKQEDELKTRKEQISKHFLGNFDAIFNNPTARVYFYEFLKSEHNSATVNFLNQMEYLVLTYGDQIEGRDALEIFDLPLIQQLRMMYLKSIFYQQDSKDTNFSGKAPENISSELRAVADEYYQTVLGKEKSEGKSIGEEAALAANKNQIIEYNKNAEAFYQKCDLDNKSLLGGKSLFGAVYEQVLQLLGGQTFIDFQNSQYFKDLIEALVKQKILVSQLKVIPPRMSDSIKALRQNMKDYIDAIENYKNEHTLKPKVQSLSGTLPESSSIRNLFKLLPCIDDQSVFQKMAVFRNQLLILQEKLQADQQTFSNIATLFTKIGSLLASIKLVLLKSNMFISSPSEPSDTSSTTMVPMFTSLQFGGPDHRASGASTSRKPSSTVNATNVPAVHKTGSRTLKENSARVARTHWVVLSDMQAICKQASAEAEQDATAESKKLPKGKSPTS